MSVTRNICPECLQEEEALLRSIQKYIRNNPQTTIDAVSEEMDVEKTVILKFIRENRIVFKSSEPVKLNCSCCGASIPSGTLCTRCRNKLTGEKKEKEENPKEVRTNEKTDKRISVVRDRRDSGGGSGSVIKGKFKR